MVFVSFPLEEATTYQDVKLLYQRVEDLIQKHLSTVTSTTQMTLEISSANSMIGFALFIIKTLAEVQKNFIDPFIIPLVRVLQRLARDLVSSASHVKNV